MDNTNYIKVGSPEYFVLKYKVKFLRTMDIPLDKIKTQFKERYTLNQDVFKRLFKKESFLEMYRNRSPIQGTRPDWFTVDDLKIMFNKLI